MAAHSRKPPAAHHQPHASHHDAQPSPSLLHIHNHNQCHDAQPSPGTAPRRPSLLRLPSTSSHSHRAPRSPHDRRTTNPSTPTLTPGRASSPPAATSPSYFSPQPASSKEARSPATRKPPAFFSGHGIDASKGPPNSLITRGNVDIARRSQNPADFAFAQQQLLQAGLVSPGDTGTSQRRRRGSDSSADTSHVSRQSSVKTGHREQHMESFADGSSYGPGYRSQSEEPQTRSQVTTSYTSGTDGEQAEDLFIAAASSSKVNGADASTRADRLRSRIAVRSNRQSFPSALQSSSTPSQPTSRLPSSTGTAAAGQQRRASHFSSTSRIQREQSPATPGSQLETPKTRHFELSPKLSFSSSKSKDQDLSPHQFLSQISSRRPSYPDTTYTPPNRAQTFRPSNLHYSSSREQPETPKFETHPEVASRADGTESLDSTGPAASVWDELDELKSRIRRIELGGKIPTTSAAIVNNATADRPRTANTSVTTVSSSPKHQRKANESPAESTAGAHGPHKVHPLLKEALTKAKQNVAPSVYRVLEATASEAIGLAELAGSAGPQGTLHSASSILSGALVPDRQVRRKADNICRSLTELCIELCGMKVSLTSPVALRSAAAAPSRRPSVQVNGESPQVRASIEPESDAVPRSSPSRAMSRIEARRASLLTTRVNGGSRQSSQEPPTPSQTNFSRLNRSNTSHHQSRRQEDEEEDDDDPTLRAPSRAMTDFRDIRAAGQTQTKRMSRDYSSKEPMPELQPSPSLKYTSSLRRPTVSGHENNPLQFRDGTRRYILDRQNAPAYEKPKSADLGSRLVQPTQYNPNRATIGAVSALTRSGSLGRRRRGNSAGE